MAFNSAASIPTETGDRVPAPPSGLLATLGIAAGLGAVAASSCCVIPLALGALGAGAGIFSGLEAIAAWRTPMLAVSALAVATAWWSWWRKREAVCMTGSACATPRRSRTTLALLSVASVIMAIAAGWNYLEPVLLRLMRMN